MKYRVTEKQYNMLKRHLIKESYGRNQLLYDRFSELVEMMKKSIAGKNYEFDIAGEGTYLPIMHFDEIEKIILPSIKREKITRETHPHLYKTIYTDSGAPKPLKVPSHTNPLPFDDIKEGSFYTHHFDNNGFIYDVKVKYYESNEFKNVIIYLIKPFDLFSFLLNKRRYEDGYEHLLSLATQYGVESFGREVENFASELQDFMIKTVKEVDPYYEDNTAVFDISRDKVDQGYLLKYGKWEDEVTGKEYMDTFYKFPNSRRVTRRNIPI